MVQVSDDVDVDIGANASQEEESETYEKNVRTVNNIVEAFRLQETSFDKKSYMTYIKGYMKSVSSHLEKTNPDRVAAFQKAAQPFVKKVLADFNEYQFFTGESMDIDGMIVLCIWRNEVPVMIYFKDGFEEMKVVSVSHPSNFFFFFVMIFFLLSLSLSLFLIHDILCLCVFFLFTSFLLRSTIYRLTRPKLMPFFFLSLFFIIPSCLFLYSNTNLIKKVSELSFLDPLFLFFFFSFLFLFYFVFLFFFFFLFSFFHFFRLSSFVFLLCSCSFLFNIPPLGATKSCKK